MAAGLILEMSICVGVMRPGMHFLSVPWTILKCAKLKKKKKTFYVLWLFMKIRTREAFQSNRSSAQKL